LHEGGLRFKPDVPLSDYDFTSPLLGFKKSASGYSGWYAPATGGRWDVEMRLSSSEAARMQQIRINGSAEPLRNAPEGIRFYR